MIDNWVQGHFDADDGHPRYGAIHDRTSNIDRELEPHTWLGVLYTTLCDKVCQ